MAMSIIETRARRHEGRVAYAKGRLGGIATTREEGTHPYGFATTLTGDAGEVFVWTANHRDNDDHNEITFKRA